MTKDETLKVLAILKAAYPANYSGMSRREAEGVVTVWALQFADVSAEIVLMAVQKLISTSKYPPVVSEVKSKISAIHWEAYEALANSKAAATLPEEVQRYEAICAATEKYRNPDVYEPPLSQMIGGGTAPYAITGDQNRSRLEG